MTDLATLSIRVDTLEMKQAQREMDVMESKAGKLERSLAGLASALGVGLFVRQFLEVNTEFQRLGASLQTVTGSSQEAARAFTMLQDFAKSTPYELTEVTQAFINLKTRGLDASKESMTALGNYASSFNRSMTDMVQAISGVVMGETEAIKSFGVTAQAMGDKVALSFRGQTTIVKRNAMEIQGYFTALSNANFADGMDRQVKTLGGAWANLKDQIALTFFAMGNAGASQKATDAILGITNALAEATPSLAAFTAGTIKAVSDIISIITRYKAQIGLVVAVLGAMAAAQALVNSTMIASALTTLLQGARVVALTFATSGYSVAATVATLATQAWNAASLTGVAAAGALAAAIAILYVAYQNASKEAERLNKEVADNKIWHDRAKVHKDFGDSVTDLTAKVALMRKALAGDKNAKAELDDPAIAAYRKAAKELGSEGFDRQIQARIQLRAEEKRLQGQIDARNKAMKDAAEEEQRKEGARKSMIRDLREQAAVLGMNADEVARLKAAMVGLGNNKEVQTLLDKIRDFRDSQTLAKLKGQRQDSRAAYEANQVTLGLEAQAEAYQTAMGVIYPYRQEVQALRDAEGALNLALADGNISLTEYEVGIKNLQKQMPILTETFGDLRQTFDDWARSSTDALVELSFTGKAAFSDLITSMLKDLARLALYKNVTGPLFDALGTFVRGFAGASGGGGGVSTTFDTSSGGGGFGIDFNAPTRAAGSRIQSAVTVQINQEGAATASSTTTAPRAAAMGRDMESAVLAVIFKHQRPGGALARG